MGRSGPVTGRAAHKRRLALLAILVAARGRPVGRERVIGLLWPEHPGDAARHLLSESLYVLRKELGEQALRAVGDEVALAPGVLRSDVAEFEEALEAGRPERAVEVYGGPFLQGFYVSDAPDFERWAEGERERLARANARALEQLAEAEEHAGRLLEAAEWWRRLSAADPFSSRVALRRVRALDSGGERGAALRVAAAHVALLKEELGVAPDADFCSFFERLREEAANAPDPEPIPVPNSPRQHAELDRVPTPPSFPGQGPRLPAGEPVSAAQREQSPHRPHAARRGIGPAHIGALVGLTAGLLMAMASSPAAVSGAERFDPHSIAVLYFEPHGHDPELAAVANALTVHLIRELGKVRALTVISSSAVRSFRDRAPSHDSIASMLKVGTLVTGSVQRSGDRFRVSVEMADAAGRQLAAEMIEMRQGELFAVQDQLVDLVSRFLRRRLGEEIRLRSRRAAAGTDATYRLVVRGERRREEALFMARSGGLAEMEAALRLLEEADSLLRRAERAEPRWVQPTLGRGWVALAAAELSADPRRDQEYASATLFSDRALERDPESAEALELRGTARWRRSGTMTDSLMSAALVRDAEVDLREAVRRDPARSGAWSVLGQVLLFTGKIAEATEAIERAVEEDPFLENDDQVLIIRFFGAVLARDYGSAGQACDRGRQLFPHDYHFYDCRLTLMREDASAAPDTALAWRLVGELDRIDPPEKARASGNLYRSIYRRVVAAAISARAGDAARARAEIARARRDTEGDPTFRVDLLYDEAYLHLVLGDTAQTLVLLDAFADVRPQYREFLSEDPLFAEVWSTRRGRPRGNP